MRVRRLPALLVLAVLVAGCGSSSHSSSGSGGVYRVGWEKSFGFTDGFDPTGERSAQAWGIYSNLLVRTLVGYNHAAGVAGKTLVPDIASSVPRPTDHGRTYTFLLRSGVQFGPPLDRDVTSADVLYAFERLGRSGSGAQYASDFDTIAGFHAYRSGKVKSIRGITTAGPYLIAFHLAKADPGFVSLLSLPATGPIPKEVAGCFTKPAGYGRDLVSTGPYMIEGANKVDASSCAKLEPMSGFDGTTTLTLDRNPDYNAATDSPAARQNLPDQFDFRVDRTAGSILSDVAAEKLNDEIATMSAASIKQYTASTDGAPTLHRLSGHGSPLLKGPEGPAVHVTSNGTLWQGDQFSFGTAYAHAGTSGGSS